MTIDNWIARWAETDRIAFHFEGATVTYGELDAHISATADHLEAIGVGPGDRVAFCGLNRVELFEVLFACARLRAILVPLNNRLSIDELRWQIDNSSPTIICTTDGFDTHLDPAANGRPIRDLDTDPFSGDGASAALRPVDSDDSLDADLLMVHTSGTTGNPKGAILTQDAVLHTALNSIDFEGLSGDDIVLMTLPTFHVGGLNIHTLPSLYAGAQVVLHRRFDPGQLLESIAEHRPTQTVLVPAMLAAVAAHPDFESADLSCFTGIGTGSSVVPESLMSPFFDRGIPVAQVYGATETGPTAIAMPFAEAASRPTSCGRVSPHTEMRIVAVDTDDDVPVGTEGEIWLRGRNLFDRYWNDEAETVSAHQDGWYKTGDVGYADSDGYVWVSDRLTEMIITGGENVYPAELEHVIAQHPAIAEVAIVGRHDLRWGEAVVAVVVPADGEVSVEAIRDFCTNRLARYKHPTDVVHLAALPKTALGKVQKHLLREQLGF